MKVGLPKRRAARSAKAKAPTTVSNGTGSAKAAGTLTAAYGEEFVVELDHCFAHLSYYGLKSAEFVADRFWELAASKGRDDNPHRFTFLQIIGVAPTDAEAEDLYAEHVEYFFHKLLAIPSHYSAIPGCLDYTSLIQGLRNNPRAGINLRDLKARDFYDRNFVIVGSPKTVREQLLDGVKRLRVGHLLTLLQFGSMPTQLAKSNIDLFAREVLPHLAPLWEDQYEDRWWPERLRKKRATPASAARA